MSIELKQAAEKALVVLGSATSFMSRKARDQHESVVAELRTAIQQAEAKTDEPVAWLYIEDGEVMFGHPNGYRPPDARPLVFGDTHPAPGVPDDVAQDAQRYRWLRRKACVIGKTTYCGEETGQPILDFVNLPDVTEVIRRDSATTLDAAIDAAMLTASPAQKGGE